MLIETLPEIQWWLWFSAYKLQEHLHLIQFYFVNKLRSDHLSQFRSRHDV